MIILSATNLTKMYGVTPILTGISFHINKGDRIGIVGVNGAGKSTLLNILTGELKHDEGDFFVAADTTIGYLRQKDNFDAQGTVYEEMLNIFRPLIDMEAEMEQLSAQIARLTEEQHTHHDDTLHPEIERLLHRFDDMTAEFADVSVGGARSAEGWDVDKGWNQLIVRTAKGQQLVDLAREKGVLEFRSFGDEEAEAAALDKIMRAAASKRSKALKL